MYSAFYPLSGRVLTNSLTNLCLLDDVEARYPTKKGPFPGP